MPLLDLIAALEREAEQRAATIRREAEVEARDIVAAAETRTAAKQQQEVSAYEAELEASAHNELTVARRAARAQWLVARSELLARVHAAVRAQLDTVLNSPAYRAHLAVQLERAWRYVEGPAQIRCTPSIAPIIRVHAAARADTTVAPDADVGHGFCIRAGAQEVSSTLEDAVEMNWPKLSIKVMRTLGEAA
jgi:vacuolar-type H+-ATPase subunit E/Vma4